MISHLELLCSAAPSDTTRPWCSHNTIKIVKNFILNSTFLETVTLLFTAASNSKFRGAIRHVLYFSQSLPSYT